MRDRYRIVKQTTPACGDTPAVVRFYPQRKCLIGWYDLGRGFYLRTQDDAQVMIESDIQRRGGRIEEVIEYP